MLSLKTIKQRIISVKSTEKMTKAMKLISAVKLRRYIYYYNNINSYYYNVKNTLPSIIFYKKNHYNKIIKVYLDVQINKKTLLIILTSDKGLVGNFNNKIFNYINDNFIINNNILLFFIGNKGANFYYKKYKCQGKYNINIDEIIEYKTLEDISKTIIKDFTESKYHEIKIIYNGYDKMNKYNIKNETLLPLSLDDKKYLDHNYILEYNYDLQNIVFYIKKFITIQLYKCIYSSLVSENMARMIAMDKASNNAKDLFKELNLQYNNIRQHIITKEIIEIMSNNLNNT